MSDRRTEDGGPAMLLSDSEQGELRIEINEFLNNHFLHIATRAFHCLLECLFQLIVVVDIALTMT